MRAITGTTRKTIDAHGDQPETLAHKQADDVLRRRPERGPDANLPHPLVDGKRHDAI
ncbi:MAG: hypothetical protein H8M99_10135, partial [Gloeobacteraceae cyanobacterium ES-bin-144]|nr:hypothetical protein [Verrucomicrobiales bacterium]